MDAPASTGDRAPAPAGIHHEIHSQQDAGVKNSSPTVQDRDGSVNKGVIDFSKHDPFKSPDAAANRGIGEDKSGHFDLNGPKAPPEDNKGNAKDNPYGSIDPKSFNRDGQPNKPDSPFGSLDQKSFSDEQKAQVAAAQKPDSPYGSLNQKSFSDEQRAQAAAGQKPIDFHIEGDKRVENPTAVEEGRNVGLIGRGLQVLSSNQGQALRNLGKGVQITGIGQEIANGQWDAAKHDGGRLATTESVDRAVKNILKSAKPTPAGAASALEGAAEGAAAGIAEGAAETVAKSGVRLALQRVVTGAIGIAGAETGPVDIGIMAATNYGVGKVYDAATSPAGKEFIGHMVTGDNAALASD